MDGSVLYSKHGLSSKKFWTGLASTIWIMYKSSIWIPPVLQLKIIGNWTSDYHLNNVQWASEIRPFEIPKHLKSILLEGLISNDLAIAIVPTIQKCEHSKSGRFCPHFEWFWHNGSQLSRFQMVGLLDFRSHWKSGPFATQPLFGHSKSRLVQISDPHCNWISPTRKLKFVGNWTYLYHLNNVPVLYLDPLCGKTIFLPILQVKKLYWIPLLAKI